MSRVQLRKRPLPLVLPLDSGNNVINGSNIVDDRIDELIRDLAERERLRSRGIHSSSNALESVGMTSEDRDCYSRVVLDKRMFLSVWDPQPTSQWQRVER